ncbi:hypothetical protein HHI36_014775 [Cryptolaemus montrouzieri]|uniref:Uncharacterized protein n=1 Tax=Cryptolaemus montrouzieri TaxID=559131 RepID=A0ABD2N4U2_9CUCU
MKSTRTHVMRKLSISISNHIKNSAPAQPKEKLPVNRRGNIPNSLPEDIKSTSSAHVKEKLTLNVEKKLPNSITEDTKNATSTNVKINQPFDIKDTLPDSISNGIKTTNLAHVKKKLPMHTEKKLQQSISRNRKNPISICSNENQTESSSTKDNDLVRSKINDDKTFVGISEDCLKQQKHEGKDVEVRQLKKRKNTSKYFDEDVMLGVQMKKRSHIKTNDVQQMDQENEEGIEILEIKANKQREKPKTEEKTEEQPIQQKVAGLRPNKEVISDDVNSHQEFDEQQLKVHDQNIVAITSGNVPEDEAEMKTVNVIKENIVIENVIEQINITIEITEKNNVGDKVTDLEPANKMDLALPSIQNDLEQHDLSIKLEEKLAKPSLKAEESREIKYVDKEKLGHEISDPKKDMCNVPIIEVGKCTPCTSVGRNCSKIPKSIYPVLSKDNNSKIKKEYIKLCQCINGETNTEQNHFIGKPEKRQDKQEGQILHCKNCKSCNEKVETNVFTSTKKMVDDKKEDNKCKRSCFTRKRGLKKPSISIPCKRHILQPKDNEISWNINEHTYKSQRSSSTYKSCKEKGISLCSMSSRAELASTLQEIMTYKGKNWPSTKSLISETRNSQIYHCHTANNTENIDKSSKLFQRKRCTQSQTGGTLEQDMIASYVASCSTNPERRHSQQFIIQTLLYHFAGYEHNKECTSRRRQRFAEKPRVEIKKRSTNSLKQYISMRSIQVQVGPICSLKCEGAQTVTTFVITDTNAEQEIVPSLEAHGRINYICGPDVPGIRTKIAMNLNQLPSYTGCSECSSDLKNIESSSKSSGECEPPICSYFRNENHYIEEVDCTKPCCSVLKKDKYVFITVTPVQTEPYEPNYFIIVTSPNNVNKNMEEEIKPTKDKRKPGKLSKKLDVPSKLKESLDHSKKAMFSVETLKSRELFKLVNKQPSLLRVAGIAESTHGSSVDLPCITAQQHLEILKEFELACIQGDEFKSLQDNCCGPDSCENFIESRIPPKDECVECCFSKEKNSTRTVACGSHNCILQKEVDEERFEDAYSNLSTMNSNHKKPHKITKNIRCGPEICSFMMPPAEINLFGINLCTSTQTDDLLSNRISFNSPNVIMVTLGCDAFTMDSTNVTESEMDCCDLRKCKNSFEKGESDRRECMERKICGTDLCTNAREKLEGICFTDGVDLCDSCTIKADILCDPYIRSMNNKDRLLEDSFNDPSLCRSIGGSEADQCDPVIRENQYYDTESADVISKENEDKSEACGDKDCPEKTNKDYIGGSTDFSEGDNEGKKDEREDVVCSRKHVTTKLDQNDLFALELAVNRFIKAKPESINEK